MADDDGPDTDAAGGSLGPADKKDTPAAKKQVKNEHILIAVGVISLIVTLLYLRRAASGSSSSTAAAAPGTTASPYGYGQESASTYDQLQNMASDMQTMQQEIVGLTPQTPSSGSTAPTPATPATPDLYLSGFQNGNQVAAALTGEDPNAPSVYYESSSGTWSPLTWANEGQVSQIPGVSVAQKTSASNPNAFGGSLA